MVISSAPNATPRPADTVRTATIGAVHNRGLLLGSPAAAGSGRRRRPGVSASSTEPAATHSDPTTSPVAGPDTIRVNVASSGPTM